MNYFCGIDLHRRSFTFHGTDQQGILVCKGKRDNSVSNVYDVVTLFPRPPAVVIEATRNWMWMTDAFKDKECKVTLAHPLKTKAIASARIKTDTIDAATLCHLLRADLVPASYIPTHEEQEARELSRGRVNLVRDQTHLKNRIYAIIAKENVTYGKSDLFGVGGRAWLKDQSLSYGKAQMVSLYSDRLTYTRKAITTVEQLIDQKCSGLPQVTLLTSIPGIGTTTAFLLAAEIGDITRFDSPKKLASYLGLVPRLSQSGNHAYYGRITKLGNPYVRWSLVQTAHRLARMNGDAKRFVNRISYRGGKKKAIVALARKLVTIIYCVLQENRPYIQEYSRGSRPAIIPERS